MALLLDLEDGLAGQAAEEDALDRVLEDLEHVRELEDERAGLVAAREPDAPGYGFETRDWEPLVWFREDDVLEFEDFAGFLLDLHVVVVAMVANPLLLFGNVGGLRHFSRGIEIGIGVVLNWWKIFDFAL